MIELCRVSKRYAAQAVLSEVSMRVEAGTTVALVGPSGAGKTTALKLINRLVVPSSGSVLVDGEDVAQVDTTQLRRRIGYVVQEGGLFPHLTARGNVEVVPRLLGWGAVRRERRARELFELVRLPFARFADRYPCELSGGQRQRVGLARALAADPRVVLLDEPFGALDPITRRELQQEMVSIQRELRPTMVLVTHDVQEAFTLGDKVAVMAEGRLLQLGTAAELRERPASSLVAELVRLPLADAS